jgi:hypothetical protein
MAGFLGLPARAVLLSALLCLLCAGVFLCAQAASADYTNDLPSVERVKAEIKGKDPTDTLARQAAVFTYLQSYISRIKTNRTVRGDYTAGEKKMLALYAAAAYQVSQDYAKAHTAAEAAAFERLHGNYEMDAAFYDDWSKRLIGPQTAAAYTGAEAGLAASGERFQKAITDTKPDRATPQATDQPMFGAQGLSNDPTAVAARRCLELGGSSVGCMGKGIMAGAMDLIGFTAEVQESLTGPGKAGAVLSGIYTNPATVTSLSFAEDAVSINDCGKLANDPHNYTVEKGPGSLRITVDNEPRPIVLTMRPDGGLIGPGAIDVKGRIIIGYHTETKTVYRNGAPAAPGTCDGPCSSSVSVPEYAPKIERCAIGSLAMPPTLPPASASTSANDSGAVGFLTGFLNSFVPDAGEVGIRMTGQYGGGKLLLDFRGNSLILDCGEAHVRPPYTVENTSAALVIHVQNPGGPFTLTLQPDNSLRGSGSTAVNGRLVSGMKGEDVTFAPHSETCDVGAFRPKGGGAR